MPFLSNKKLMTVMKFSRTNLLNCFVFCASLKYRFKVELARFYAFFHKNISLCYKMTRYFANVLYFFICMLENCSCFYFRLLTFFKIKLFLKKKPTQDHHQSVKQFGSRWRPTFCWSSSGFKLFAKGYWQTTKLSTGMQRVKTGKYFSVQYIVSYREVV